MSSRSGWYQIWSTSSDSENFYLTPNPALSGLCKKITVKLSSFLALYARVRGQRGQHFERWPLRFWNLPPVILRRFRYAAPHSDIDPVNECTNLRLRNRANATVPCQTICISQTVDSDWRVNCLSKICHENRGASNQSDVLKTRHHSTGGSSADRICLRWDSERQLV